MGEHSPIAKEYGGGGWWGIEHGGSKVQRNLSIKDTFLMRTVSAVPTTRDVYKSASELGTPLYTG